VPMSSRLAAGAVHLEKQMDLSRFEGQVGWLIMPSDGSPLWWAASYWAGLK
jgi:hypothetical protein